MTVSTMLSLQSRLALFEINEGTRHAINLFHPVFHKHLDGIVAQFYLHLYTFPEGRRALTGIDVKGKLAPRQKAHWLNLFTCDLDEHYAKRAAAIGRVHYERRIPPYLYMAGYTFVHSRLIAVACEAHRGAGELPQLLASISRLIALDMDLALSAYTREHWREAPVPETVYID
jgi:heme-based aerotactic transducer